MQTLIRPDSTWQLWSVIVCGTTISIYLEQRYRWAAKLSGPVLALAMAMALSNLGIMPTEAPSYEFVSDYLIPLAIPLLLLRANLFRIARDTGWMFVAFHISCFGTMVGAALATLLLQGHVESSAEIAGVMTASYTGGSVNFFAVRDSFHLSENLANPLLVADNLIMAAMFIAMLAIAGSRWFLRHYSAPHTLPAAEQNAAAAAAEHWQPKRIGLLDIAISLAIALTIVAVADLMQSAIREWFGQSLVTSILGNRYVLITFVSMVIATALHRWVEKLGGAEEMGSFMLYIFLFTVGLPADLLAVLTNVPLLFLFCLIIAITNLVVTLTIGRLLNIDLEELLLSVNATLGGAPSAAAMAIAKGWSALVLPAILVGIWGYVIGTFLGVTVGELLLRWM